MGSSSPDRSSQESLIEYSNECFQASNYLESYIALREASRLGAMPKEVEVEIANRFERVKDDAGLSHYRKRIGDILPEHDDVKKKFLLITNIFPPQQLGGMELIMWELASEIRRRGHTIRVLCADHPNLEKEKDPELEYFEEDVCRDLSSFATWGKEVKMLDSDFEVAGRLFQTHQNLIKHLEDFKPDCCILGNTMKLFDTTGIYEITNRGIVTIHAIGTSSPGYHPNYAHLSPLYRFAPCSDWLGEHLKDQGYVFYPYCTLYPIGGLEAYYRHYQADFDKLRIVFSGQIRLYKGIAVLIDALAKLHKCGIDFSCEIAGAYESDEDLKNELGSRIETAGMSDKVKFIGWLGKSDLRQLYCRNNVMVFPSTYEEPFGRSAVEAMASGMLLVSSGTGGQAEIFEDGKSGVLFENENASDLADKLEYLSKNKEVARSIALAGQERAFEFDIAKAVDRLEENVVEIKSFAESAFTEPEDLVKRRGQNREIVETCNKALELYMSGNKEGGNKLLEDIQYFAGLTPQYFYGAGLCHFMTSDFKAAYSAFFNSLVLDPSFWCNYFYIGLIFKKVIRHPGKADQYLKWAMELNPGEAIIENEYEELQRLIKEAEGAS